MAEIPPDHRAGFVNIVGHPNVGKSTLMNALLGERLAIITHKPQTTRQRMLGILNTDDLQIVFSDTPGRVVDPRYEMHRIMNRSIQIALEDADVILMMTTVGELQNDESFFDSWRLPDDVPRILVINKVDTTDANSVAELAARFGQDARFHSVHTISALHKQGVEQLLEAITALIPVHPPYFPKDQLTDKPERFFVAEIIREKILELYQQEVPYSCEVLVESFKHEESRKGPLIRISATIYVARKTQKAILIGKGGEAIKKLGTAARKDVETFLNSHVFLELYVKVRDNWRDDERTLRSFGYH